MKYLILILFLPFFLMADINEEYSELFCQYLSEENFDECEEVLDDWEIYYDPGPQVAALRALSFICKGKG